MNNPSRRNMLRLAALAPLAGTAAVSNDFKPALSSSDAAQQAARKRVQELHLPNVPLITHEGKKVRFYDDLLKNKIVSLNFFFANCDEICPIVMPNLVKVRKILGDKIGREMSMYTITLKPQEDNVSVIRNYRKKIGADWTFFTGKPEDIELVRKGIGFSYPDPKIDGDKTQHIGNVRYGNEALMLWAACPGMAHAEWIAESFNWMVHPELSRVQLDSPTSRPKDAHAMDHEHMHASDKE